MSLFEFSIIILAAGGLLVALALFVISNLLSSTNAKKIIAGVAVLLSVTATTAIAFVAIAVILVAPTATNITAVICCEVKSICMVAILKNQYENTETIDYLDRF